MKRIVRACAAWAAGMILAVSCQDARVSGHIEGLDTGKLAVKQLNGDALVLLDSVAVKDGDFVLRLDVDKGNPKFVYLYNGHDKIASLLVSKGERIALRTDLGGNGSVEGSPESDALMQIERDYSAFVRNFSAAEDVNEANRVYLSYMRDRIKYLTEHPDQLSTLPIFYQTLPGSGSIFSKETEALRFRAVYEALKEAYPASEYLPGFEKIVLQRENLLALSMKMASAGELGAPEISLPDVEAVYRRLSEVQSKVVMIYFWVAADNRQKMLNNTMIKVAYEKYHERGLEIYAVSFDTDKSEWARAVANQQLHWINVNDNRGLNSPYIATYNLQSIPTLYFLLDGEIQDSPVIHSSEELDRYLSGLLK